MQEKRVPLAWSVRWRRIRSQGVPATVFLLALVASGWLWRERGVGLQSIGEVSSPQVNVTSPTTGRIVTLAKQSTDNWSIYDRIEAGEVIARIEEEAGGGGETIELSAPISGTLVAILCSPGQTVVPGQLIATIAADHGRHIVGYIPEESTLSARPGMRVTLRSRAPGSPVVTGEVEVVGGQVARIPRHQRASATMPQWGTPVRIKVPGDTALRSGALVDVMFERAEAR